MKRIALAALFASLTVATAAPAFADEYDDAVAMQISKYLAYPTLAVDQETEGRVGVKLDVDASGHVTAVSLDNHSGSGTLDRATLKAVRALAPTLTVAGGSPHTLHVYVNYKLT
jgi:TonB family protein